MAYFLVYTSPLYSDRQAEPQLAVCPECLGEIYEYDLREAVGTALYHKSCVERMMNMEIEEICRQARSEGLSYGQYVYIHRAELAGKRPVQHLRPEERRCRRCGRAFVPVSGRHRFCRTACRVAWNQEKHRGMMKEDGNEG